MSRQVGGGRWTASPGVDSRCGRVDSFGRARSARRKFSTRMRSCRTCVQTLMIMSGQLGPGRVDSGRCHEWTVRQLLQVGATAFQSVRRGARQGRGTHQQTKTQRVSWVASQLVFRCGVLSNKHKYKRHGPKKILRPLPAVFRLSWAQLGQCASVRSFRSGR